MEEAKAAIAAISKIPPDLDAFKQKWDVAYEVMKSLQEEPFNEEKFQALYAMYPREKTFCEMLFQLELNHSGRRLKGVDKAMKQVRVVSEFEKCKAMYLSMLVPEFMDALNEGNGEKIDNIADALKYFKRMQDFCQWEDRRLQVMMGGHMLNPEGPLFNPQAPQIDLNAVPEEFIQFLKDPVVKNNEYFFKILMPLFLEHVIASSVENIALAIVREGVPCLHLLEFTEKRMYMMGNLYKYMQDKKIERDLVACTLGLRKRSGGDSNLFSKLPVHMWRQMILPYATPLSQATPLFKEKLTQLAGKKP